MGRPKRATPTPPPPQTLSLSLEIEENKEESYFIFTEDLNVL